MSPQLEGNAQWVMSVSRVSPNLLGIVFISWLQAQRFSRVWQALVSRPTFGPTQPIGAWLNWKQVIRRELPSELRRTWLRWSMMAQRAVFFR